jgi:ApbE superfamily uncharacterized protein (UPF0280 family)
MMEAQRALLADGRWHFQHGPIDIVIGAEGDAATLAAAHEAAWQRFRTVLPELVAELPLLRLPVRGPCPLQGVIARRMWHACRPYHSVFVTPMAAVAGSVAQELIGWYEHDSIERAWVNNGGDIALHLAKGSSTRVGLFADLARLNPTDVRADGHFDVTAEMPVRGIATSGWRGRSFSLGIADSVTVLAATAAQADAAATVIANAVDVADAAIQRRPASECKDDSDLGDIPVTVAVGTLPPAKVHRALDAGAERAAALQRLGLAWSVALVCQGQWRVVQPLSSGFPGALPQSPGSLAADAVGSVFA